MFVGTNQLWVVSSDINAGGLFGYQWSNNQWVSLGSYLNGLSCNDVTTRISPSDNTTPLLYLTTFDYNSPTATNNGSQVVVFNTITRTWSIILATLTTTLQYRGKRISYRAVRLTFSCASVSAGIVNVPVVKPVLTPGNLLVTTVGSDADLRLRAQATTQVGLHPPVFENVFSVGLCVSVQVTVVSEISPIDGFVFSTIDLTGSSPRLTLPGNEVNDGPTQGLLQATTDGNTVRNALCVTCGCSDAVASRCCSPAMMLRSTPIQQGAAGWIRTR